MYILTPELLSAGTRDDAVDSTQLDDTRALLFVGDGEAVVDLPTGGYELTITYRREVEGLPTPRIDGDSSPSTVSVTLTVTAEAQILMEAL